MHLESLFISQIQRLHSKPWSSLDLLFKSHENSSCYLLTASIVVFLLDNLETCIMHAFHLPDVICVAMKNQTRVASWLTRVLLYDWSLVLATYSVYVSTRCSDPRVTLPLVHVSPLVWLMYWPFLVHVSPFDWFLCQILNFVLTGDSLN